MKNATSWLLVFAGALAVSFAGCTREQREPMPGQEQAQEQAFFETPSFMEETARSDINRMDKFDFMAMGLSEDSAEKITEYRDEHGNFASVDELGRVPGIDMAWVQQNKDRLDAGTQAAGEARDERTKDEQSGY